MTKSLSGAKKERTLDNSVKVYLERRKNKLWTTVFQSLSGAKEEQTLDNSFKVCLERRKNKLWTTVSKSVWSEGRTNSSLNWRRDERYAADEVLIQRDAQPTDRL